MYKIFIDHELPHKKSRDEQFEFVKKMHDEITKLNQPRMFDHAMVSIIVCIPSDCANNKIWDVDNRAINLILNNLKGIFFVDDNYSNVSLFVCGKKSKEPETVILIDTYSRCTALIWATIKLHKYYNNPYRDDHRKGETCEWKNGIKRQPRNLLIKGIEGYNWCIQSDS